MTAPEHTMRILWAIQFGSLKAEWLAGRLSWMGLVIMSLTLRKGGEGGIDIV